MNKTALWNTLSKLISALRSNGSWAGETHLQKATYMLQEVTGVPLGFKFVLYKHGPYSFDLTEELGLLKSAGVVVSEPQTSYGAKLAATKSYEVPTSLQFDREIQFIAENLGSMGVAELERIGTAMLVSRERPGIGQEKMVQRLCHLKPHVTPELSKQAFEQLERLVEKSKTLPSR